MFWQALDTQKGESWFSSTEAAQVEGVGCIVRVASSNDGRVAEALTFVPGVVIQPDGKGGRKLVRK
jgi:hypothetical protein